VLGTTELGRALMASSRLFLRGAWLGVSCQLSCSCALARREGWRSGLAGLLLSTKL